MEKYISSLIKIANNDLISSKILYKKKLYPQSLFLLQQSIEKSYKAVGLLTRQINIDDLKDVGHDFIKMLKKGFNSIQGTAKERIISSGIKKIDKSIVDKPEEIINSLNETKNKEFYNLSESQIQSYFDLISKLKRTQYPLKYTKKNNLIELYNAAMQNKNLTSDEIKGIQELINSTTSGLSKEDSVNLYNFMNNFYALNIIGLITSPNFEQSRYPLIKDNHIDVNCPNEVYTSETPIIKNQRTIMRHAEKAIKFLQEDNNVPPPALSS